MIQALNGPADDYWLYPWRSDVLQGRPANFYNGTYTTTCTLARAPLLLDPRRLVRARNETKMCASLTVKSTKPGPPSNEPSPTSARVSRSSCTWTWSGCGATPGSDAEQTYRTVDEIAATERDDPLLRNARRLVESRSRHPRRAAGPRRGRARPGLGVGRGGRPPAATEHHRGGHRSPRSVPSRPGRGSASASRCSTTAIGGPRSAPRSPRTPPRPPPGPWPATSTRRSPTSWRAGRSCSCSARTWPARAASTTSPTTSRSDSARGACSTPCSTRPRSSASPRARPMPACCRFPRSSTWPTSTTRSTRSGARPPACSSSAAGSSGTRWSSACQASPTRRASAATSTTTTRLERCATSRAWCWRCRRDGDDAARMLRGCIAYGARGRAGRALPRADRALPRARPPHRWRRRLAGRLSTPARAPAARRGRAVRRPMHPTC